jgi:hypothetical protein
MKLAGCFPDNPIIQTPRANLYRTALLKDLISAESHLSRESAPHSQDSGEQSDGPINWSWNTSAVEQLKMKQT